MTPADIVNRWKVAAQIHPALEAGMDAIRRMKSELGQAGITDDSMYDDEFSGEVRCKDGSTFTIKVDILSDGKANLWASANVNGTYAAKLEASKIFHALSMKGVTPDKVINALWSAPELARKAHALVAFSGAEANKELLRKAHEFLEMANDAGSYVDDDPNIQTALKNIREGGKTRLAEALGRAVDDFAEAQHKYNNALESARRSLDDAY